MAFLLAPSRTWANFLASSCAAFSILEKTQLPTARRDLIGLELSNENLAVFARQTLTATSWFQPDEAAVSQIFKEMIDDVILGRANARDALKNAAGKVNPLFGQ